MRKIIGVLLVGMVMVACSSPQKKMTNKVTKLESEIQKGFSKQKADELIVNYNSYIEKFPKDTTSRLYMAKGAEVSILNNDPANALKFIETFLTTFPDDPKAPLMQFKKAMVYDLLIHDGIRAVAEYEIFVQKYPNDPMRIEAENAILLIQNPETFMATFGSNQDSTKNQPQNQ